MLPEEFLQRMKKQLGPEFPDYLQSLERPRAVALRFNPRKGTPDLPFAGEPVPWEPMGRYCDPQSRPGLHPYHDAGVYYLQEASAMAPVALLDPQPGERICDLCAAPGGKSTQIAGRMGGAGLLVSNEIHPKRAGVLSRNMERMGVANALVTNESPRRLAQRFPGYFHRILVDAPCSGEGMFRKEEAAVADWSLETVKMCAERQMEILEEAAKMLMPGGRLVYSTCTFAPEEDEGVAELFLQKHPEFSPEPVEAPWFQKTGPAFYRLWPHKLLGEGHFAAVFRKNDGNVEENPAIPGEKLPRPWTEFAQDLGIKLPDGKALCFGDRLFWAPTEMPGLEGLKVLRPGLELGTLKKDRLEPAHALALWLRSCGRCLETTEPERYLRGEVLPGSLRGWCLVRLDGFSLGWGKGDGSMVKNHYPKGLRRIGSI